MSKRAVDCSTPLAPGTVSPVTAGPEALGSDSAPDVDAVELDARPLAQLPINLEPMAKVATPHRELRRANETYSASTALPQHPYSQLSCYNCPVPSESPRSFRAADATEQSPNATDTELA